MFYRLTTVFWAGVSLALFCAGCGLPLGSDKDEDSDMGPKGGGDTSGTDHLAGDTNVGDTNFRDTAVTANTLPAAISIKGAVQKGPFVIGSTVSASPLNGDFSAQGTFYKTSTVNNLGEFTIRLKASGPVALEGMGFYYNEVTGTLSAANLTLRALYYPGADGEQLVYINLVTHLIADRVKMLVSLGASFQDAVAQAETELWEALGITAPD
ncbi:MAG: hypothetical protein JXX14_23880, partial [Deltaproteobacteria bacterium]|nr:hypothetical protein [Deltaproteobacteria bacterium]